SSRGRHTRFDCDWSSDVCSSDLVGNGDVVRVRRGDLEEDAAGGPALVQLAGRVQEARAVARGGRAARRVAQVRANLLDGGLVREIGRASWRERGECRVGGVSLE